MNHILSKLCVLCFLLTATVIVATPNDEVNKPIPEGAQAAFRRAEAFAEKENFAGSLVELKKAIASAPNFLQAHIKYIKTRAYFMEQAEETRREYEALMTKNPSNPVYPAALAIGLSYESPANRSKWFESVIKLAPDWTWSHYARAYDLLEKQQAEPALSELLKQIEKDPAAEEPYTQAFFILRALLKNNDSGISLAEKFALQPEHHASGLLSLWEFRLKKSKSSEEAKNQLRQELSQIVSSSKDVVLLASAYSAYKDLLGDKTSAATVEQKIMTIDKNWFPERGAMIAMMTLGENGPFADVYAGRQIQILNKFPKYELDEKEQIAQLKQLLLLNPGLKVRKSIYKRLLTLEEKADNTEAVVNYGEMLIKDDPTDFQILAKLAVTLANQKANLKKALDYAQKAEALTKTFQPIQDLSLLKDGKMRDAFYSEEKQMEKYHAKRAEALDSSGYVLYRMGKKREAEQKLREAVKVSRSEKNLAHLAEVLRALNRIDEANQFETESRNEYRAAIKRKFRSTPSKDFELAALDGRKLKLSDLKGKVVMVNFWATWCKPCVKEMPVFAKIYDKFKDKGFEILAVSVDDAETRPQVANFVKNQGLNFPILYDEGAAKLYGVSSYPTTFFIDRKGNILYQSLGFSSERAERDLEVIINEIMNN